MSPQPHTQTLLYLSFPFQNQERVGSFFYAWVFFFFTRGVSYYRLSQNPFNIHVSNIWLLLPPRHVIYWYQATVFNVDKFNRCISVFSFQTFYLLSSFSKPRYSLVFHVITVNFTPASLFLHFQFPLQNHLSLSVFVILKFLRVCSLSLSPSFHTLIPQEISMFH